MNAIILIGVAYLIFRDQIDPLIFGEAPPSTNMPILPGSPSQPATTPNTTSPNAPLPTQTYPQAPLPLPTQTYPQAPLPLPTVPGGTIYPETYPQGPIVRQVPTYNPEPEWPGNNNCLLPGVNCPPLY